MKKQIMLLALAIFLISNISYSYQPNFSGEISGNIYYDFAEEDANAEIVASELVNYMHEQKYLNALTQKYQARLQAVKPYEDATQFENAKSSITSLKNILRQRYDLYKNIKDGVDYLNLTTDNQFVIDDDVDIQKVRGMLKNSYNILDKLEKNTSSIRYSANYIKKVNEKVEGASYIQTLKLFGKSMQDFYVLSEGINKVMLEKLRDKNIEKLQLYKKLKTQNELLKTDLKFRKIDINKFREQNREKDKK